MQLIFNLCLIKQVSQQQSLQHYYFIFSLLVVITKQTVFNKLKGN